MLCSQSSCGDEAGGGTEYSDRKGSVHAIDLRRLNRYPDPYFKESILLLLQEEGVSILTLP